LVEQFARLFSSQLLLSLYLYLFLLRNSHFLGLSSFFSFLDWFVFGLVLLLGFLVVLRLVLDILWLYKFVGIFPEVGEASGDDFLFRILGAVSVKAAKSVINF